MGPIKTLMKAVSRHELWVRDMRMEWICCSLKLHIVGFSIGEFLWSVCALGVREVITDRSLQAEPPSFNRVLGFRSFGLRSLGFRVVDGDALHVLETS